MRKRSSYRPRAASKMLAPSHHNELMMGPRMHLHLLCEGTGTREHLRTVAALFNIGTALAHLAGNESMYANLQGCLKILCNMAAGPEPLMLAELDQARLRFAFNELDGYMSIQNRAKLVRALEYVDRALLTGEGVEIIVWPTNPTEEDS